MSTCHQVGLVGHVHEGVSPHQDVEDREDKGGHLETVLHRPRE